MKSSMRAVKVLAILLCLHHLGCWHSPTLAQNDPPAGSCFEADRVALLGFKASVSHDTTGALSTWIGTDCCGGNWDGVECNPKGRVTRLVLQVQGNSAFDQFMKGTLSPSLGNLQYLETLMISGMRYLGGSIPQSFTKLTHLTELTLEDNSFQGVIPSSLGNMVSLQTLSLSGNKLSGQIPPTLGNLRNLQSLTIGRNSLTGSIPSSFKNLINLQAFDFSNNSISGTIPDFIGQFRNLQYLFLSNNQFSGQIPTTLCNLKNLTDLLLDNNRLTGNIPPQIGNMKSLSTLQVASNQLTGQIPQSISQLQNLWHLDLTKNMLTDPLPNILLPSLKSISLSYNNFNLGRVPDWITRREVSTVSLAGCRLRGFLPNFTSPDTLDTVDLSDNYFTDGISNFFTNMTYLAHANISNNQLKSDISTIKLPFQLNSIDLHSNQLYGSLAGIFASKSSSRFLDTIDVSNNQISGSIPEISSAMRLKVFNISKNKIGGQIPSSISNLTHLERIDISRNQIGGTIPTSIGSLQQLKWLDISNNALTGKIPASMLGINGLRHANFRSNRLCGEIPQGRPYNVFRAIAYAHNMCLCGKPLPPCRTNIPVKGQ